MASVSLLSLIETIGSEKKTNFSIASYLPNGRNICDLDNLYVRSNNLYVRFDKKKLFFFKLLFPSSNLDDFKLRILY